MGISCSFYRHAIIGACLFISSKDVQEKRTFVPLSVFVYTPFKNISLKTYYGKAYGAYLSSLVLALSRTNHVPVCSFFCPLTRAHVRGILVLHYYERTILEEWVEEFYIMNNIRTPSDLTIENISTLLGIGVTFAPGVSDEVMFDEEYTHIFINSLYSPERRWEVFCHELCHPLRHMGNQSNLPNEFRKLQEMEANAFQFYAALPFFMVRKIRLPEHENEIIDLLAREFGVTHRFAKQRLEQIQRRILCGRSQHEFVNAVSGHYD